MLIKSNQYLQWQEGESLHKARWLSQSNHAPPKDIVIIDDTTTANEAYGWTKKEALKQPPVQSRPQIQKICRVYFIKTVLLKVSDPVY